MDDLDQKLLAALKRDGDAWRAVMRQAMAQDFGWAGSSRRYRELYESVLAANEVTGRAG